MMYRSDIVRSRQSFYNESNLHADTEVCYQFLEHHDYGFVHQVLSFHRVWGDSMSSYSQTIQTNLFGRLYHLLTYGPKYLSKEELEGAIRENLQVYYRSLGRQVWRQFLGGGNRDFWSLHRGKLASLGYPLSHARLAANAFSCLLENVLDPKRTVEKIARRLRC